MRDKSFLKILTFGQDLCKSQLSGNWTVCTISESWTKKQIPKSKCTWKTEWDRSVWKFWLLVKIQSLTWSNPFLSFFFFFFRWFRPGQDEQVKHSRPGQTDQTIVGGDVTHDIMVRVNAWETVGTCERVNEDGGTWECVFVEAEIFGHYWGAWLRVSMFLGLKFSGFVHFKPWKTLVWSVFWNLEHICTDLKEEPAISEACGRACRRVFAPVSLIF